jgi:hypothetical protein
MKMKKHSSVSDNSLAWIGAGVALVVAIIFGKLGMPQKWHAAIMWTVVAFGPPMVGHRKRWGLWSFWLSWAAYLSLHVLLMWVVFAYLLARVRVLGTMYVVPFAAIEAFVLLVLLSKRDVHGARHSKPKSTPESSANG